jgi:hypothetical protein
LFSNFDFFTSPAGQLGKHLRDLPWPVYKLYKSGAPVVVLGVVIVVDIVSPIIFHLSNFKNYNTVKQQKPRGSSPFKHLLMGVLTVLTIKVYGFKLEQKIMSPGST